jgi:hypothetical protein
MFDLVKLGAESAESMMLILIAPVSPVHRPVGHELTKAL